MLEIKVKNDNGEMLNLSTSSNYTLYNVTGITPLQMNINTSVNATSDGSTVNSVRANNRNIVLYVAMRGNVEASRLNLYKYFPPKKQISIYCKTDNRDVCIEGITELIDVKLFSNQQVAQISIICAQPYFKDVHELITSFSQIDSLFSFPFSIDSNGMELSIIGNDVRKNIINAGEVDTGMIMEIFAVGTVVKPIIYDVLNRTHIKLDFTMETNDIIRINTYSGSKSITLIRDGVESNIISHLVYGSKWLVLNGGDNVFTFDAENGVSNIRLTFRTLALYGGI
jgi:hypothetical protein